ncbi:LicD family protein [Phascolarctobacterium sp.]
MHEVDINELKELQISILDVVDAFCRSHKIKYWLDSGTLLGAVRHQGYIPWDDDIDIGMLRKDYDKFLAIFNNENNRYKVISNEISSNCYYPYAKVLDTNTILYEPDENGIKLSINIDIFVYDNAPNNKEKCIEMYNRRDLYNFLNLGQFGILNPNIWYKKIAKQILRCFVLLFPKGYFSSKIVKNSKKYKHLETVSVGNFTSITRMTCNKRVFDSFILVEFEGKKYPAPVGYDEWLTQFYGDYMQLPPVEKRVSHHSFKAYMK